MVQSWKADFEPKAIDNTIRCVISDPVTQKYRQDCAEIEIMDEKLSEGKLGMLSKTSERSENGPSIYYLYIYICAILKYLNVCIYYSLSLSLLMQHLFTCVYAK